MKPRFLLLIALIPALWGCIAADESKLYFDQPLGPDYAPTVTRQPELWPSRVLILPVSGQVTDEARNQFEIKLMAELRQRLPWVLFTYDDADSTTPELTVTEDQAVERAKALGADSIMQIDLSNQEIYSPLRLVADVRMESVATRAIFYRMTADYDARDERVATSARRYYQREIVNRHLPERSLTILNNFQEFIRFTGYDTGKLIADSFLAQQNRVSKAEPVSPSGDQNGTYFQQNPEKNSTEK